MVDRSRISRKQQQQIIETNERYELQVDPDDWWAQEEEGEYRIGCPSHDGRPALILIVEAAQMVCGVDYIEAIARLKEAIRELENRPAPPFDR